MLPDHLLPAVLLSRKQIYQKSVSVSSNRGERVTLSFLGPCVRAPFFMNAGMTHKACCSQGNCSAFCLVWNLSLPGNLFSTCVLLSSPLMCLVKPFVFIFVSVFSLFRASLSFSTTLLWHSPASPPIIFLLRRFLFSGILWFRRDSAGRTIRIGEFGIT